MTNTPTTRKSRTIAKIRPEFCTGCEACIAVAPHDTCFVKAGNDLTVPTALVVCEVQTDVCIGCTLCPRICPWDAITMVPRVS
ncbi:MAG: hypothetical protein KBD85_05675 [Elusimicrobia bacterium]|nr:hypothetical protein [Elusimicrobiota bacterium]MBP9128101.1 hypothetical protein [Elusimicrobiota bacterium]MBP9699489.1 hypothetical protein [Elusimicrobiota bacterium]